MYIYLYKFSYTSIYTRWCESAGAKGLFCRHLICMPFAGMACVTLVTHTSDSCHTYNLICMPWVLIQDGILKGTIHTYLKI